MYTCDGVGPTPLAGAGAARHNQSLKKRTHQTQLRHWYLPARGVRFQYRALPTEQGRVWEHLVLAERLATALQTHAALGSAQRSATQSEWWSEWAWSSEQRPERRRAFESTLPSVASVVWAQWLALLLSAERWCSETPVELLRPLKSEFLWAVCAATDSEQPFVIAKAQSQVTPELTHRHMTRSQHRSIGQRLSAYHGTDVFCFLLLLARSFQHGIGQIQAQLSEIRKRQRTAHTASADQENQEKGQNASEALNRPALRARELLNELVQHRLCVLLQLRGKLELTAAQCCFQPIGVQSPYPHDRISKPLIAQLNVPSPFACLRKRGRKRSHCELRTAVQATESQTPMKKRNQGWAGYRPLSPEISFCVS
jgi:hypothetical protein